MKKIKHYLSQKDAQFTKWLIKKLSFKNQFRWFVKFNGYLMIIWFLVASGFMTTKSYFDYMAIFSHEIAEVKVARAEKLEEQLTPIQEFYQRYENDLEFRNYIDDMNVKRNNPGNLIFMGQPGATDAGGFASFKTPLLGFRALIKQVERDQARNLTIRTYLERYAPSHENDTEHLISEMSRRLGLKENTNIININTILLAQDLTRQEHSVKY